MTCHFYWISLFWKQGHTSHFNSQPVWTQSRAGKTHRIPNENMHKHAREHKNVVNPHRNAHTHIHKQCSVFFSRRRQVKRKGRDWLSCKTQLIKQEHSQVAALTDKYNSLQRWHLSSSCDCVFFFFFFFVGLISFWKTERMIWGAIMSLITVIIITIITTSQFQTFSIKQLVWYLGTKKLKTGQY